MNFKWIRELFSFSRQERNGIVGLLLVIFLLILTGKLIPLLIPEDHPDFSKWETEVNAYLATTEKNIPVDNILHPVTFDPNKTDSLELLNIGLAPGIVANWIKYLKKGGRFREKQEVRKIFGMTSAIYDQLDSFIVIPGVEISKVGIQRSNYRKNKLRGGITRDTIIPQTWSKKEIKRVDIQELNSTDSLHLLDIPGIGPVFASRIIRYRNLLGGYYAVAQLKEVYGLKEDNFNAVSQYFTADESTLVRFNINFSTVRELGRHPYVGFRTAQKICKLRDKTGKFSSPDNLSPVMTGDSLKRLVPYLKFTR